MVELLVSIALIAIVMVFLVRLLVDVRYDGVNEQYDTKDQINRAEIIKTIESDFANEAITSINDIGSTASNLKINISTKSDKAATIEINQEDSFIYTFNGSRKKWSLKNKENNSETHYKKTNIPLKVIKGNPADSISTDSKDYLIIIDIPLLVDESMAKYDSNSNNTEVLNDSTMDNIRLTFYSYEENLFTESRILNRV